MSEGRVGAAVFGATMIVAVAAPVLHNVRRARARDSFPLSHYPMFSAARGDCVDVTQLFGATTSGRVLLPCRLLGPGGMNQHRKQLRRAATRQRPERVTERVARRISTNDAWAHVQTVQLVTCRYRLDHWFDGCPTPVAETVHAATVVARHLA